MASARTTFSARIAEDDGRAVLRAEGELDFTVAAQMRKALSSVQAVPGQRLTVDASHLGFIDVCGTRLLIAADERLRGAGGAGLAVRGASGIVRRMFEIMRVTSLLDSRDPPAAASSTPPCRPGTSSGRPRAS